LCVDGVNSYECDCSDTGFKGDHCQINVDDCESAPCTHGSQCVDLVKDYKCTCFPGYDGKNCENDINECDVRTLTNFIFHIYNTTLIPSTIYNTIMIPPQYCRDIIKMLPRYYQDTTKILPRY